MNPPRGATALRRRLAQPEPLMLPFAYDAWSALLVAEAGFEAVALSGSGVSASLLGVPDVGVLGRADMVDTARRVCAVSPLPVLVDADTGYGGTPSAVWTAHELESAGAAGMIIEDQRMPKRCGHLAGVTVIEADVMVQRIRTVAAARRTADFVIVGRTDALAATADGGRLGAGFDAAVARARAYLAAGADLAFVSALESEEQLLALPARVDGPLLVVLTEGGRSPLLPRQTLANAGYRVIGYAGTALGGATHGALAALAALRESGTTAAHAAITPLAERNRILGLERWQALDDGTAS